MGSFAKFCAVDWRRHTELQIQQNGFKLNDILLHCLANHDKNSGGSVLKPLVFRQISGSVDHRMILWSVCCLPEGPSRNPHTYRCMCSMHVLTSAPTRESPGGETLNYSGFCYSSWQDGTDGGNPSSAIVRNVCCVGSEMNQSWGSQQEQQQWVEEGTVGRPCLWVRFSSTD